MFYKIALNYDISLMFANNTVRYMYGCFAACKPAIDLFHLKQIQSTLPYRERLAGAMTYMAMAG